MTDNIEAASTAFGQLVRSIGDPQLRALMRAVFYRERRYEAFCHAPLSRSEASGTAIRSAIRSSRLLRAVYGHFAPPARDLMLAALLLYPAGAAEASGAIGRLYPVPVLSALMVHDARVSLPREKRASLESLILQAAWLTGEPGVAPAESTRREAQMIALCLQLDRRADALAPPRDHAVRWSGQAPHLKLIETYATPAGKDDDDDTHELRTAAG
ncbi:MAG: hypothetical protein FWC48_02650 [Actinomycetia bacterium]|nr:hypothetical protein [Actinomycetes bacterium]